MKWDIPSKPVGTICYKENNNKPDKPVICVLRYFVEYEKYVWFKIIKDDFEIPMFIYEGAFKDYGDSVKEVAKRRCIGYLESELQATILDMKFYN